MRSTVAAVRVSSPWWFQPLRWFGALVVAGYYHAAYRLRGWGRLARTVRPRLIVANHQHEAEGAAIVADVTLASFAWRHPIFTVSSRRMWEPGFMAARVPFLAPLVRHANFGRLFSALGLQPIENELQARALSSIAYVLADYGEVPIEDVLEPDVAQSFLPDLLWMRDALDPRHAEIAARTVPVGALRDPYQREFSRRTRRQLALDVAHFEALQRDGATIFLTPEGFYSGDGRMQPLRGIVGRLSPGAEIYAAGISYDPFAPGRLGMLYRIEPERAGIPLEVQIRAARPVTVSALLGTWLHERARPFSIAEAVAGVRGLLDALPPNAHIDPALLRGVARRVRAAARQLRRLQIVVRVDGDRFELARERRHPEFPRTHDVVAYQRNFHEETVAALVEASGTHRGLRTDAGPAVTTAPVNA